MFEVGQKVWCAIYGAGVVDSIQHPSEGTYPVVARFENTLGVSITVSYTRDGKYYSVGNITLFPYPFEIVKADTKPSIDWSHVSLEYDYLVQDSDGEGYLCSEKPSRIESGWNAESPFIEVATFTSYVPGTCGWKDSLVKRPE